MKNNYCCILMSNNSTNEPLTFIQLIHIRLIKCTIILVKNIFIKTNDCFGNSI